MRKVRVMKDKLYCEERKRRGTSGITKEAIEKLKSMKKMKRLWKKK